MLEESAVTSRTQKIRSERDSLRWWRVIAMAVSELLTRLATRCQLLLSLAMLGLIGHL